MVRRYPSLDNFAQSLLELHLHLGYDFSFLNTVKVQLCVSDQMNFVFCFTVFGKCLNLRITLEIKIFNWHFYSM